MSYRAVPDRVARQASPDALAAAWPTFRHDNRRSSRSASSLVLPLAKAWSHRSKTPPSPAWTGPAKWDAYSGNKGLQSLRNIDPVYYVTAADGRVFFGSSSDGAVHCLDATTGAEAWRFFTEGPVRIPPTWSDGLLLAGSDDGSVYCLDAGTGDPFWQFTPRMGARRIMNNGNAISQWPCRTGVMVAGDRAHFAVSLLPWLSSDLCAVDIQTGTTAGPGTYVRSLDGLTLQGALLASDAALYAPQGRSNAQIYRLIDGEPQGAMKEAGGVDCLLTPDGRFFSGPRSQKAGDDVVHVSDTATGNALQTVSGVARMVANDQYAFFHRRGTLVCVDRIKEAPLLAERVALQKAKDKAGLERINAEIKSCEVWKQRHPLVTGFALTPEHLVVGADGRVTLHDLTTGAVAWSVPVTGAAYGLAIAEGRLLVSTDRGYIVCFATPARL